MDTQQSGEELPAQRIRLSIWQVVQQALSEPQFARLLTEAFPSEHHDDIKQLLRSVGIADAQIAHVFAERRKQ